MEKYFKQKKGITLIALVITIIVLLILAGISISMLSGDNGILQKATDAKEQTGISQEKEIVALAYNSALAKKVTSGDSTKINANDMNIEFQNSSIVATATDGTNNIKVTFESGNSYTINSNGTITLDDMNAILKISDKRTAIGDNVEALSNTSTVLLEDDLGNIVKIPKGFGISEDSGTKVEDGIVIEDASYTNTKGSQFVWVPVGEIIKTGNVKVNITLGRYNFNSPSDGTETPIQIQSGTTYTPTTVSDAVNYNFEFNDDEEHNNIQNNWLYSYSQINTKAKNLAEFIESALINGGYYIARYEAGVKGTTSSNFSETYTIGSNTFTKNSTASEYLISKSGVGVWNGITQPNAATVSRAMYTELNSDLVNSYAWDTAIIFIEKCGTNSNYANQPKLETNLTTTGSTSNDIQCNIYDMAGNMLEWTTETMLYYSGPATYRGGADIGSTCSRWGSSLTSLIGFRTILYL